MLNIRKTFDSLQSLSSLQIKIAAAFATVYIIWGSTYLAARYAIETIPPFLLAGMRYFSAGVLLYVWMKLRGVEKPKNIHWKSTFIIGGLLFLGGNGGVVWAVQRIPSGVVSLVVAAVPVWIVTLDWFFYTKIRPGRQVFLGVFLGLIGLGLLISPGKFLGSHGIDLYGVAAVIFSTFCWAIGSLYCRRAELPKSIILATAMEMIWGGVWLFVFSFIMNEWKNFDVGLISRRSFISLLYLSFFGSVIAFSAYGWLFQVVTPAKAATYAYVNPIVAIILGWMIGGEELTLRMLMSMFIVLAAVVLITTYRLPLKSKLTDSQISIELKNEIVTQTT